MRQKRGKILVFSLVQIVVNAQIRGKLLTNFDFSCIMYETPKNERVHLWVTLSFRK